MFSSVARFVSIRTLLAFALLTIHQMDVVMALNGDLEEEIYMQQPKGYIREFLVCKLRKFLCGLKQYPRCWNKMLSDYSQSIYSKFMCAYQESSE